MHYRAYRLAGRWLTRRIAAPITMHFPTMLIVFFLLLSVDSATGQESLREYIYRGGELVAIDNVNLSPCVYDLSATNVQLPKTATTGNTVVVTSGSGCNWTATKNGTWITITQGNGSGTGTIIYNIDENTGPARSGSITVAGKTLHIYQASGCIYSLTPTSAQIDGSGGSGSISIACGTGCPWNATKTDSWISFTTSISGSGNGSVGYSVATNTSGEMRFGAIFIGVQEFAIIQFPNCDMGCMYNCMYFFGDPEYCGPICGCSF
jgi:hypothetical protein